MKVLQVKVPSESQKGVYWQVRIFREDNRIVEAKCNCPAFLFRNPEQKHCKHIEIVLGRLRLS